MRNTAAILSSLTLWLCTWSAAGLAADGSVVDHGLFHALVQRHVHGDLVDYAAVGRAPELEEYLGQLTAVDPGSLPAPERLAFWINAYNAYTIQLINAHGLPGSIRDIVAPDRDGKDGTAWRTPVVRIGERLYTLDEVEHGVIKEEFHEPRVHFALICAARGCPPLRPEAYTGERIEGQIEDQALRFLHGKAKGCRVDAVQGIVYVSEIFEWYKDEFGSDDASIGRFIARYLPASLERSVLEGGRFRLRTLPFDWTLNNVAATP
jgi:hypothetical protein